MSKLFDRESLIINPLSMRKHDLDISVVKDLSADKNPSCRQKD